MAPDLIVVLGMFGALGLDYTKYKNLAIQGP